MNDGKQKLWNSVELFALYENLKRNNAYKKKFDNFLRRGYDQ